MPLPSSLARAVARLARLCPALLLGLASGRLGAQSAGAPILGSPATYVGINVWLGGVTAAVRARQVGASPWRAALVGAVGGATTAAGQRLIGAAPSGARLAGLQLAALGANVSRNAGAGVAPLSDLVLPLYPFYVRLQPGGRHPVRVRLSAVAAGGLVAALARRSDRPRLDLRESLLSGAPVFRSPFDAVGVAPGERAACTPHRCPVGLHLPGAVLYAGGSHPRVAAERQATMRHEVGHVAQLARDGVLFGVPASDRVLAAAGRPGRWARGWLVADVALPLLGANFLTAAASADGARQSLYEREVRAMMRN
jgi:hypothetical protein